MTALTSFTSLLWLLSAIANVHLFADAIPVDARSASPTLVSHNKAAHDVVSITLKEIPTTVKVLVTRYISNANGTVISTLTRTSQMPIQTSVISTSTTLSIPATIAPIARAINRAHTSPGESNIFDITIPTSAPPFPVRSSHPVPRIGIDATGPIATNKFWGNMQVGTRSQPVWTHPYSVWWPQGKGMTNSWGLAISHVDANQRVYGPGTPAQYYINPVGIQSIVLSAAEIDSRAIMKLSSPQAFSVNVDFYSPTDQSSPRMRVPLVQGMGFVTAVFNSATPLIRSGIQFKTLDAACDAGVNTKNANNMASGTGKFRATLMDGSVWLIYILPGTKSNSQSNAPLVKYSAHNMVLTLTGGDTIRGPANFSGTIQVAKLPRNATPLALPTDKTAMSSVSLAEGTYDKAAGAYPTGCTISATSTGKYTFTWKRGGMSTRQLLMFALPHHQASMLNGFNPSASTINLQSTTKGLLRSVLGDQWVLQAAPPTGLDLSPFSAVKPFAAFYNPKDHTPLSKNVTAFIRNTVSSELAVNITLLTDLGSYYFSGKALSKFAMLVVAAQDVANDSRLAATALTNLKTAFGKFVSNTKSPFLVYDSVWGGIVSSDGYADPNANFGNTYYNDHHFHYGYFVYTAAVIAQYDPVWLTENGGRNRKWVESLLRDYANPVQHDPYFPFSRSFDWFHGHSWAKGLYESGDGKDQESSSEDVFSAYAVQMWGKATGDAKTEARGALMLGILHRTIPTYFLMKSGSTVHPPEFIDNQVVGILFENKCDHTTYFGTKSEYIEGIHMLPLSPATLVTRPIDFVAQEWHKYFDNGRAARADPSWQGILYGNWGTVNQAEAWNYFGSKSFSPSSLDGGASRSWYLSMVVALAGDQAAKW